MIHACRIGLDCPYYKHAGEEDGGLPLCTHPDFKTKRGQYNTYPYLMNVDECPILLQDSKLERWLDTLKEE